MSENQELTPVRNIKNKETDIQKQFHPQLEEAVSQPFSMASEPRLGIDIRDINIRDLISLCLSEEILSRLGRLFDPRIDELYTSLDLNKIYGHELDTIMVEKCVNHFTPQTVIIRSPMLDKLPVDLLSSFCSFAPKKLIIRLRNSDQQFLIHHFKIREIRIEHQKNYHWSSPTKALNSILQSSVNLDNLEVVNCSFDVITVASFNQLYLRNLTLCDAELSCMEGVILAHYITKSFFMETLILRYNEEFSTMLQLFFNQVMYLIPKMKLKSFEISINDGFFKIDNINLIPSLKSVRVNIIEGTSLKTMNYIKKITVANPDINFQVHGYTFNQGDEKFSETSFNKRFQKLANVTFKWTPWWGLKND